MFWRIIGLTAATLTCLAFIPQIIKILKTNSVEDVSVTTLLQLAIGVTLWILYGWHLKDTIIITANSITLVSLITLLILYFKYGRKKQ